MPINKEKLELRAEVAKSRPEFKRPESWRYKRLETNWKKFLDLGGWNGTGGKRPDNDTRKKGSEVEKK